MKVFLYSGIHCRPIAMYCVDYAFEICGLGQNVPELPGFVDFTSRERIGLHAHDCIVGG